MKECEEEQAPARSVEKSIGIIDTVLGEEGIIKYNATKNRFAISDAHQQAGRNFLHIYNSTTQIIENSTIETYRRNLQRLRQKIEDREEKLEEQLLIAETAQADGCNQNVQSLVTHERITVSTPQSFVKESSRSLLLNTPKEQSISQFSTLEHFKYSIAHGSVTLLKNKAKKEGTLKIKNTMLISCVRNKKGGYEGQEEYDVASCKLFIVVRSKKNILSCFREAPPSYIELEKEVSIVNMNSKEKTEVILKNTNTGNFTKLCLSKLEFSLRDRAQTMHHYIVDEPREFIRWLLLIKIRMHTVDLWKANELLESIQK